MTPEKKIVLEESLEEWYKADKTRESLLENIISGKAGVSLRVIDWFVTNYSARKSVVYEHDGKLVDVNGDYKDILRCFHKVGFDSFRRKGGTEEEAELRQKNFFKWAIANGVIKYVQNHSTEIEKDMAAMKRNKKRTTKKQRTTKALLAPKAVIIHNRPLELRMPASTKLVW